MKNKNTTTFQMSILYFFLIQSLFAITGYRFFLNLSFKNTILSILLGTMIGLCFLNFSFFLFKKVHIKKMISAKVIKICILVLLSILFSYFVYRFSSYIHYLYLNKNSLLFIIFTLLILFLYTFHIDHFIVSRTLEILFYIFLFFMLIKMIGLVSYVEVDYLLPIATNNYNNLLFSSLLFGVFTSGVLGLLYIFYNKEIRKQKIKYYITSSYIVSCMLILINYIFIISILGNHLAGIYMYPEIMILKNINFFHFIERVDYILAFEYLISIYALLSILLQNIKKIMNSFHNKFIDHYLFLFVILLFIISILFSS